MRTIRKMCGIRMNQTRFVINDSRAGFSNWKHSVLGVSSGAKEKGSKATKKLSAQFGLGKCVELCKCMRKISRAMWTHVTDKGTNNKQTHWPDNANGFFPSIECIFRPKYEKRQRKKAPTKQKKVNTPSAIWGDSVATKVYDVTQTGLGINKDLYYMIHVTISRAYNHQLIRTGSSVHPYKSAHIKDTRNKLSWLKAKQFFAVRAI